MRRAAWFRWGAVAVTTGVTGVALTVGSSPPATAAEGLRTFDDCAQLRDWYVEAALPRVTAWGLDGGPATSLSSPLADGAVEAATAVPARGDGGDALDAVGNGSTGTNVQEAGVDEPDLAKTDGRHVYVVRDDRLQVFDATGAGPRQLAGLTVPDAAFSELLLVGDRLVLLGARAGEVAHPETAGRDPVRPVMPIRDSSRIVVATVDVADPTAPELVDREGLDGTLVSAREYDGIVRVVLSSTPDLPFVLPGERLSEAQALARNRALVENATADDWLPNRDGGPLLDCSDVRRPPHRSGLGTLAVVTFAPEDPEALSTAGVAADGDLVYSSTDRLYVATTPGGWVVPMVDLPRREQLSATKPRTQLHSFELDGAETTYSASGSVAGRVHSRWALSEHDGRLRVATILGDPGQPTENAVSVLEEQDGKLRVVGSVDGLGLTEQIRSVRWFGDLAVVVTFRLTDPLYTVDLSDPTRPRVRGELKIPGYSAYLHPLGDGQLLGVGQHATPRGEETGVQVSTFDLTELERPRQVDTAALGRYTFSAVQEDSRAFTYLPERRTALVPVVGSAPAMHVVEVADDGTLSTVGRLELPGRVYDQVRALPLDDGRVAIATGGAVVEIATI